MQCSIEFKNINYENILKNINFKISNNGFYLFMGANNSGKTTLLKNFQLRKYLDNPKITGEVLINNKIIKSSNVNTLQKYIGYIPEDLIFIKENAIEEILFATLNLGWDIKKAKKEMYSLTQKLNIDDIITKPISELLDYQKLLVYIASILIYKPKIIIIDNTFEQFDNNTYKRVMDILKSMKNECIIIFVSNNIEDMKIANNIFLLKDGKIVFDGKFNEVIKQEKLLLECGFKLPFLVELSEKLKFYNLIDDTILNKKEMVDKLWN